MTNKNIFALLGITLIAFVSFLEYTVVNTALPTIQKIFDLNVLDLQWIINIYAICVAVFMIITGRLGDLYGKRFVFYLGTILLILGSLGAGLSWSFASLILFRCVQSIGVAACVTLAVGLLHDIFKEKIHHPMSFYATITGLGLAIGPTIGGIIVMYFGWRWIFFINIPILLFALAISIPFIPENKSSDKPTLDILGTFLLIITLVSFICGVIHAEQVSWSNNLTIISFATFIIALPILIIYENKQGQPAMNFRLFTINKFILGILACLAGGSLIAVSLFLPPLFLQNIMNYSPKDAGIILLSIPIGVVLFSPIVGKLIQKYNVYKILFAIPFLGFISSLLIILFSYHVEIVIGIIAFLSIGVAWALLNVTTPISAANSVTPSESGAAVGTTFSTWNISAAISITISSVIFNKVYNSSITLGNKFAFILGFRAAYIYIAILIFIITIVSAIVILLQNNLNTQAK